jgi:hypothetical protein
MNREEDLLPVSYFHVVFTLPGQLNPLCRKYPETMYTILFRSAWETVEAFSLDHKHLGAQSGMIAILHTWGQQLWLHPHVHCIIPGGGINPQSKWKHAKSNGKYLFPKKALSKVFRGKYMDKLGRWAKSKGFELQEPLIKDLYKNKWVVYAKRPFLGPQMVIEYLGRYTHKIAISNHRIKHIDNGKVTFTWKDYRDGEKRKVMTLQSSEFLRRFCLHILPPGYVRIRHYGFLSCRKKPLLRSLQQQMGLTPEKQEKLPWQRICKLRLGFDVETCPCCGKGIMVTIQRWLPGRSPPIIVKDFVSNKQNEKQLIRSK